MAFVERTTMVTFSECELMRQNGLSGGALIVNPPAN